MAGSGHCAGADTERELVWGEFEELSAGGERRGPGVEVEGGDRDPSSGHTCQGVCGQPVGSERLKSLKAAPRCAAWTRGVGRGS